jgi:hypothetical protein
MHPANLSYLQLCHNHWLTLSQKRYFFCHICSKTTLSLAHACPSAEDVLVDKQLVDFTGISLYPNFISEEEETNLVGVVDLCEWKVSQSGRRKQVCVFRAQYN